MRKYAFFLMAVMLVASLSGCGHFDDPVKEGEFLFSLVFLALLLLCLAWDISVKARRIEALKQRVDDQEDKIRRLEAEMEDIRWRN